MTRIKDSRVKVVMIILSLLVMEQLTKNVHTILDTVFGSQKYRLYIPDVSMSAIPALME
jgi:hypothetical protein